MSGRAAAEMRTIDDMTETKNIIASIQNRLRELDEEIGVLSAARAALDGHASRSPSPRRNAATRRASASRSPKASSAPSVEPAVESGDRAAAQPVAPAAKPRRRAPRRPRVAATRREVVPAEKLEKLLSDTDGLTTSALAETANGDRDQVLTLLRELETAGRIRRTGQRRSTRWHVITDEDRIRERAAELAARSRSAA